jgi:TonB-linked SusC/RagA family outer membrane protein
MKKIKMTGEDNKYPHGTKLWRIMKITCLLLMVFLVQVSASTYSQSAKLTLNLKNVALSELFSEIEKTTEFRFFYDNGELDLSKKMTLNVEDSKIEEVLDNLFKGSEISYEILDRYIIIKTKEEAGRNGSRIWGDGMQQRTISGKVTDTRNQPLPGVTVVVKGTTQGTVTNADGEYSLSNIPANASLQFSFVGMKTQEVVVENQANISVVMEEEAIGIGEVVAIGYGSKRQSELSSSVSVVNEEKLQSGVTSTNLGTLLQGKVPGLVISNNNGHPQRGTNIVIRGVGSIGAGYNPLYVVDGIIGGSYNPSDIESITVLKDAAATGLYGSRAANGVILITTKSGKSGKTKITYDGSFGITNHRRGNLDLMNSTELYENRKIAAINFYNDQVAAGKPDFTGKTFDQYFSNLLPSSVLNTNSDWPSLLTRTGNINKHNISISGGNDKTTFFISGNFYDELGTLINEDYQEFNLRANLSHQITDNLKLIWRMNGQTDNFQNDPQTGQEATAVQYFINVPWDPVYEADGITPYNPYQSGYWYSNNKSNYFYDRTHYSDITKTFNFNTDLKLELKINDYISFSTSNRFGINGSDWKQLLDNKHALANFENGRLSQTFAYTYSYLTSNLLNFQKKFGNHNVSGVLGQEYSYSKWQNTNAVGIDIPVGLSALSATGKPKSIAGTVTETGFESFFSQVDYNYMYRYFLVGSVRTDASSRFGANNRWATFYTMGASWNINKEDFLSDVDWLEILKLKFSYGTTGNANISDYLSLGTYSFAVNNTYNGNSGTRPARLENPDLTWEKAYTTNIGLEFAVSNVGKLEIDYYNRENKDLLQSVPLSAASGFANQQRNVGSVRNRGFDLNINTINIDRTIRWETNMNININRNKILALNNHEDIASGVMRLREGLTMNYFYMKEWAGVDPQTGDPLWVRWEDDNEIIIHGADKKEPAKILTTNDYNKASNLFIKTSYPDFTGGISNDFYYKNFTVSIYCNYVVGNSVYFSQRESIDDDGKVFSKNQMNLYKDWVRWEKPGDIATHPRLLIGGNKNSSQPSSRYLEDGSYFKIQNIRFSYTFPDIFSGLKVYAGIDNLAVFTKFSGTDPDINMESPNVGQSIWGEAYGAPRKIIFGVNLNL